MIPYFIALTCLAFPLLIVDLALGRYASLVHSGTSPRALLTWVFAGPTISPPAHVVVSVEVTDDSGDSVAPTAQAGASQRLSSDPSSQNISVGPPSPLSPSSGSEGLVQPAGGQSSHSPTSFRLATAHLPPRRTRRRLASCLGSFGFVVPFLVATYYIVIQSWTMSFAVLSVLGHLDHPPAAPAGDALASASAVVSDGVTTPFGVTPDAALLLTPALLTPALWGGAVAAAPPAPSPVAAGPSAGPTGPLMGAGGGDESSGSSSSSSSSSSSGSGSASSASAPTATRHSRQLDHYHAILSKATGTQRGADGRPSVISFSWQAYAAFVGSSLLNTGVLVMGVTGGIERVANVGMPALLVISLLLLIRVYTLDFASVGGVATAGDGVAFLLDPSRHSPQPPQQQQQQPPVASPPATVPPSPPSHLSPPSPSALPGPSPSTPPAAVLSPGGVAPTPIAAMAPPMVPHGAPVAAEAAATGAEDGWVSMSIAAFGQVFFTASVGFGSLLTYGSYLPQNGALAPIALATLGFNELVELGVGGLLAIPASYALFGAEATTEIAKGGSFDLGFVAMPAILASMPLGRLFALIWFTSLFIAAITSAVSLLQPAIAFCCEEYKMSVRTASLAVTGACFVVGHVPLLGLGAGALDEIDFWGGTILLLIYALLQCLVFAHGFELWGAPAVAESRRGQSGDPAVVGAAYAVFRVFICVVIPLMVFSLLVAFAFSSLADVITMPGATPSQKAWRWLARGVVLVAMGVSIYVGFSIPLDAVGSEAAPGGSGGGAGTVGRSGRALARGRRDDIEGAALCGAEMREVDEDDPDGTAA